MTSGQVSLLKRYTENIYLSLDADFAGDAAAHHGIEMADNAGLNIRVVTFSEGKDPDELIKKDPGLWRKSIADAVSFYDFIINSAFEKHDPGKPEEAKKIVTEIAKFIEPIENQVVKNHYLKKLVARLSIDQDALETELTKEYKKLQVGQVDKVTVGSLDNKTAKSRPELLEEYLLSLLLQAKTPSDYLLLIAPRRFHHHSFRENLFPDGLLCRQSKI